MYDEEYLVSVGNKVVIDMYNSDIYCKLVKTVSKKEYSSLDIVDSNGIVLYNIGYEKDNPFWSNKLWTYKTIDVDKIVDTISAYLKSSEYYELVAITTK